jgi:molybdopterin synthase catalytic subunit
VRVALTTDPIDLAGLLAEVAEPAMGATSLFVGTVRETNDGRAVAAMDYSAYTPMAERELSTIVREAGERFGVERVVVVHRIGTLAIGDASVAIAVAHGHRAPSIDAMRYIIEELKQRVPIWKREHYLDGTREWIDPTKKAVEQPT